MVCRYLLGALALSHVAALPLLPAARADDRMQLGSPAGSPAEFQSQVGDRVFFSEGSADLGARARAALEAQAAWLIRHPALTVTIEGHADDAGAAAHNLEVSRRRAEAVRRRLIEMGVAPERISTVGYGRDRLIAECTAPACTAQNRRVVTVIAMPPAPTGESASAPQDAANTRRPRRLF
jgi:peptidoglycan-associated lipoprotein